MVSNVVPGPPLPTKNVYVISSADDLPQILSQYVLYNLQYDPGDGVGLYYSPDGLVLVRLTTQTASFNPGIALGPADETTLEHDGTTATWENTVGDLLILGNADANYPTGSVYILDPYALVNEDGGYTSLNVGLRQDQVTALWGGSSFGAVNCETEVVIFNQGGAGGMRSVRVNGTFDNPTAVLNGQNLFAMQGYGWDTVESSLAAEIRGTATENWGAAAHGSQIHIAVNPNGGTGGTVGFRILPSSTAGHSWMLVYDADDAVLKRVVFGADGSGSIAGHKMMQVAN